MTMTEPLKVIMGMKMTKILSTTDYDKFSLYEKNRAVSENHVQKLINLISIQNDLHLHPLIISPSMHIIDGQHRLQAAKRLGLTVYYLIDETGTEEKISTVNSFQKSWRRDDYLNYYARSGYEDYIKLEEFAKTNSLSLTIALTWLTSSRFGDFKSGRYIFKIDPETCNALKFAKRFMDELQAIFPEKPIRQDIFLHSALRSFFSSPNVNADRFFDRLSICKHLLSKKYCLRDYLDMLCAIYNYRMSNSTKITYMVSCGLTRMVLS